MKRLLVVVIGRLAYRHWTVVLCPVIRYDAPGYDPHTLSHRLINVLKHIIVIFRAPFLLLPNLFRFPLQKLNELFIVAGKRMLVLQLLQQESILFKSQFIRFVGRVIAQGCD